MAHFATRDCNIFLLYQIDSTGPVDSRMNQRCIDLDCKLR